MRIGIDGIMLNEVGEWLDRFVKGIQVEMQNQGINASGNLSNSLEWRIEDTSDGIHASVLADNYFLYAEKGRDRGRIPYDFGRILADWTDAKGISVPSKFKDRLAFGWAIAGKIRNYGSKRHRDRQPADVVGDVLDRERPKLNEILENRMTVYVNDSLFNFS